MVSPVMIFGFKTWPADVYKAWGILRRYYVIETNDTCGTHVHISPPREKDWDIGNPKPVCGSILYFENAIEALVPPKRRNNILTKANWVDNHHFHNKSLVH